MASGAPAKTRDTRSASGVRGMAVLLPAVHGLGVEIEQTTVRVVGLLQHFVVRAAVVVPELVLRVERRRVQRLPTAEVGDGLLDRAVVERLLLAARKVDPTPEAEVDVGLVRPQRVERPARVGVALPQWAEPHRLHAGLAV